MPRAAGGAIIRQPTCAARKPRMSTATRMGGSDQLDADVARKREYRSIANHGTGRRRCACLGQQEIRVAIISRRMTCDAV
ncbi:hypothetical protein CRM91_27965 [Burkholderia ambifaria]|uniref:Uncharacterized protein n=1 Tax=Burkholderia ambifaria (strain ATCC BAA-244 / DSM 16087 / CCUG 44356 / LMG 19182 / AMMD) TaxID=339670 RepID=Q0BGX2_BURCM|nr:hypothetical protein Bamb_1042 [Burkholderia ambifaria AMMD]PEH66118.1 hypothetical protein CRM91_27965 [Burkholderia ambifaria]